MTNLNKLTADAISVARAVPNTSLTAGGGGDNGRNRVCWRSRFRPRWPRTRR